MNISKKIIVCAAVCAALCAGATAYAAGSAADKLPAPLENSVGADITKTDISDVSVDAVEAAEPAETAPSESAVSVEDSARIPHVLPSKFAPEDMDLINTGYPNWDPATFIPAELNSEVYAAADGEVVAANYVLCGLEDTAVLWR